MYRPTLFCRRSSVFYFFLIYHVSVLAMSGSSRFASHADEDQAFRGSAGSQTPRVKDTRSSGAGHDTVRVDICGLGADLKLGTWSACV